MWKTEHDRIIFYEKYAQVPAKNFKYILAKEKIRGNDIQFKFYAEDPNVPLCKKIYSYIQFFTFN